MPTRIYLTAANRKPFILPALVSAPSNLSDSGRTGRFGKSKQWKRSHPLVVETSWSFLIIAQFWSLNVLVGTRLSCFTFAGHRSIAENLNRNIPASSSGLKQKRARPNFEMLGFFAVSAQTFDDSGSQLKRFCPGGKTNNRKLHHFGKITSADSIEILWKNCQSFATELLIDN